MSRSQNRLCQDSQVKGKANTQKDNRGNLTRIEEQGEEGSLFLQRKNLAKFSQRG